MGYFDIDDIMTEATDLPCRFNFDIPGLGFLENNPGQPIRSGTKLKLPFWLCNTLATMTGTVTHYEDMETEESDRAYVELIIPEFFNRKVINAIKSDPNAIDLHSINPYFYSMAKKWIELFYDKDLAEIANDTLLQRSILIHNHSSSINIDNRLGFLQNSTTETDTNKNSNNNNNSTSNHMFLLKLDEFEKEVYRNSHSSYKDMKKWLLKS